MYILGNLMKLRNNYRRSSPTPACYKHQWRSPSTTSKQENKHHSSAKYEQWHT